MPTPEQVNSLTVEALAKYIDHTVLAPNHTITDVEQACEAAIGYGFASVAAPPYDIERVVKLLAGTDVAACGTVGIPLGHSGRRAKMAEAQTCVDAGAAEIDMLMNLVAARSGRWSDVRNEITAVRSIGEGLVLKVIIECCYLSDAEKRQACDFAVEAGADFVKTSTGFGKGGATTRDVTLMREAVGDRAAVKAAGGIRTFEHVKQMLLAGATRIGTSTGMAILQEFRTQKGN